MGHNGCQHVLLSFLFYLALLRGLGAHHDFLGADWQSVIQFMLIKQVLSMLHLKVLSLLFHGPPALSLGILSHDNPPFSFTAGCLCPLWDCECPEDRGGAQTFLSTYSL